MNKLEKSEQIIDLIINLTDEGKLQWEKVNNKKVKDVEFYRCDINLTTGEVYELIFSRSYDDNLKTYECFEISLDTLKIRLFSFELPTLREKLEKLGDTITLNQQEAVDDLYTDLIIVLSSMK